MYVQAKIRETLLLQPRGWSQYRVPSMPRNLKKVQNSPQLVIWTTLFRTNPVILLLPVSSLTLNNLHYILSDLKKAARYGNRGCGVFKRGIQNFKVNFQCQKSSESFSIFFSNNTNLGVHFLLLTFFDKIIFKILYY